VSDLWPLPRDPLVAEVDTACRALRLMERYRELDREPGFPRAEFRALGRRGLLGLSVPRRRGGRGLPSARTAVALLHLAYRAGTTFAKLAMQPEFCSVLGERGSTALQRRWYRPLLAGATLIGNQVTEPSAGSDATALTLVARRSGGEYVLSGTKSEVAFAADADAAIVYGRTPGTTGADGISAFLVPQRLPGVTKTVGPPDLGERWQRRGRVVYDDVRVPATHRIGEEGEGFRYLRSELVRDRGLLAAIYLGVARASWEETVRDVGERYTFGRRLSDRQAVAFPLVDDAVQLEATWLFTQRALARFDRGEDAVADTAMAKVRAADVALATLDHCIQFHGGAGYSAARPHEQRWRDVRSGPIAHGPSELLRSLAAHRLWAEQVQRSPRAGRRAKARAPASPGGARATPRHRLARRS
jgi:alkylation response protein AidB-like acyl-CoA dehydrogenase